MEYTNPMKKVEDLPKGTHYLSTVIIFIIFLFYNLEIRTIRDYEKVFYIKLSTADQSKQLLAFTPYSLFNLLIILLLLYSVKYVYTYNKFKWDADLQSNKLLGKFTIQFHLFNMIFFVMLLVLQNIEGFPVYELVFLIYLIMMMSLILGKFVLKKNEEWLKNNEFPINYFSKKMEPDNIHKLITLCIGWFLFILFAMYILIMNAVLGIDLNTDVFAFTPTMQLYVLLLLGIGLEILYILDIYNFKTNPRNSYRYGRIYVQNFFYLLMALIFYSSIITGY